MLCMAVGITEHPVVDGIIPICPHLMNVVEPRIHKRHVNIVNQLGLEPSPNIEFIVCNANILPPQIAAVQARVVPPFLELFE